LLEMSDERHITRVAVLCGHCGNKTLMTIVARHGESQELESDTGAPMDVGEDYELLKCPACLQINLRRIQWSEWQVEAISDEGKEPEEVLGDVVYLPRPEVPDGLPPKVRAAYQEALGLRSASVNAYAVMLGRVLETVCNDRKATGDTLFQRIADLGARNEIPATIVKVAHGLRKLRNVGAHAAIGSLTAKDVPVVERLARAVLEYVYTAPHLARLAEKAGSDT
jgi:Domain of unknown function (DUF4145)